VEQSNEMLLQLLSEVLHEKPLSPISPEQWPAILQELRHQSIFALASGQVQQLSLSQQQITEYRQLVVQNMHCFYGVMDAQRSAVECLHKAEIPVVILKGSAAAVSYPQPDLRCMGDVDLLVPPKFFSKAYHTLCKHGFRTQETPDNIQRHIGFTSPQGILLELHYYFSTSDNVVQNEILDQMLFRAIDSAVIKDVCGYPTPMLPDLENGLVLLAHINQHLRNGLGLRQIIDWMCYAEFYLTDEYWNSCFSDAAEAIGMQRLAMVTTAMCQTYLGLSDNIHWCQDCIDDSICEELLEYILAHGNFGRKNAAKSSTVSVVRMFRNPIRGLCAAQASGKKTWKALQTHRWLTPLAWLYQIIRWIRHGMQRGVKLSSFASATQDERQETEFLQRLGVTRI